MGININPMLGQPVRSLVSYIEDIRTAISLPDLNVKEAKATAYLDALLHTQYINSGEHFQLSREIRDVESSIKSHLIELVRY